VVKITLAKFFVKTVGIFVRAVQDSLRSRADTVSKVLHQSSVLESVTYVKEFCSDAILFDSREKLWEFSLKQLESAKPLIFEFGVAHGKSINFLSDACPESIIYGFDSFQGLEENWYSGNALKGSISTNGKTPKVRKNIKLVIGSFKESIPRFLENCEFQRVDFMLIDSDTYEACKLVLNSFKSMIDSKTIIVFDEFFGYYNYQKFEFRAFNEFLRENELEFECIGFTNSSAAFRVRAITK
jgi:hypothetical protein